MGSYGSLYGLFASFIWILMGPYGSYWSVLVLMGSYGSLKILMRPYGSFMGLNGSSYVPHACLLIVMGLYGS